MHRRVPDKTTAAAPLTPGYLAATATIELDGAGLTGTPAEISEVDGPHAADAKGGDAATSAVRRSAIDGLPSRYAVQERIGIGGSCEVYLADDRELDRVVALKVLRVDRSASADAMRARFLASFRCMGGVRCRMGAPGLR
jgi:hypothetical protein